MPTVEEFRQTLKYFKDSKNSELLNLYKEITEVRDPWRANHLDAYFEERKGEMYVLTGNKAKAEKLESCLMDDKTPGINMESWLEGKNVTNQGTPKTRMGNGDLWYWYPREGRVARFGVDSGRAVLDCDGNPDYADPVLGVYAVADAVK